jgi:alpha-L-fucosidase
VYLSPSDLHNPNYRRRSKEYDDYFCHQLRELLTNYGEICEVFFDGAEPGQRRQNFAGRRYYKMIRELQPNAVIAIRGPDVRWVGNKSGVARRGGWSVIPIPATNHCAGTSSVLTQGVSDDLLRRPLAPV